MTKQILLPPPAQVLWKLCAFCTFKPFRNLLVHGGGTGSNVIPPTEWRFLYCPESEIASRNHRSARNTGGYYGLNCRQPTILDKLSDSAILKKIERQPKSTAGFKQLVRELGLHGAARQELSARLQRLVSSGQLVQVDSDRYAIPKAAASKNVLVGKLSMHRDGYGFVTPDAATLDPHLKALLAGDIFIPPPAVGSAMHGDRVLVEVGPIRPDGRAEGRIVRPVVRAHSTVVGIFHHGNRGNYVTPIDQKISQEIVIPPGMEVPA